MEKYIRTMVERINATVRRGKEAFIYAKGGIYNGSAVGTPGGAFGGMYVLKEGTDEVIAAWLEGYERAANA